MNYPISLCCGILFFLQSLTTIAATYTVTNTANTGAGSFRNAVASAANGDIIRFNIGGAAPHVITLTSVVAITQSNLTIDASTQTDYTCGNPTVIIELGGAWPCTFTIQGTGNTIRGLSFQNVLFTFSGGGSHRLEGCWFNLNAGGDAVEGNNMGANLVAFTNSIGNIIGGTTCATRNVFSMGGITATYQGAFKLNSGCNNNQIIGNYFGTDKSGTNLLNQNSDHIIVIDNSTGITLDQNLISGARPAGAGGGFGVYTSGTSSSNLTITNNKIGVRLDSDGGRPAEGEGTPCRARPPVHFRLRGIHRPEEGRGAVRGEPPALTTPHPRVHAPTHQRASAAPAASARTLALAASSSRHAGLSGAKRWRI